MKHYNVWRKLGMGLLALACASGASLAAGAAGGSLSTDTGGRDKPQVAVSIRPLAMIVRELVGDGVEIHQLIDAGQDPHHGALQPSRRLLLDEADLVIWVGPGLESSLARPLANFAEERRVTWLPEHGPAGRGYHHHTAEEDPHPWLAPDKTLAFSRHLARVLAVRYPLLAADIEARLPLLEERFEQRMAALERRLAPLRDRVFVAEHAAYGSFAAFAGLKEAGSLSDSSGVARGARNLLALKERTDISCVAVEQAPGSRLAIQLAAALAVPVVEIDPFGTLLPEGAGFGDLMDSVVAGFEACLAGAEQTSRPLR